MWIATGHSSLSIASMQYDGPAFVAHGLVAMTAFVFVYVSGANEAQNVASTLTPCTRRPAPHLHVRWLGFPALGAQHS